MASASRMSAIPVFKRCVGLCLASSHWLPTRAVTDGGSDQVRFGFDGCSCVGLFSTCDLCMQGVEIHRIDQSRRIARIANTRVLAVDEKERKGSPRIVLVHDLLFLGIKLLQAGAVVGLQFLRREIEVLARVAGGDEIVRRYEVETEGILIVGVLAPITQGSESFKAADQRPSLRGAVGSTLDPEKENAHLVPWPRRLRDDLECTRAGSRFPAD